MIARAIRNFDLSPEQPGEEGEGPNRFIGIWSKNCAEWLISALAAMKVKTSVVGFYDAMGTTAVDYIVR